VYTLFVPYSPSYTLSPHPHPSTGLNPLPDRTCSTVLFYKFIKEKNDSFVCLR
jgi:hypothetical protein